MYEITTGTWAPGVNQTPETAGFLSRYIAYTGAMPIYTASSYDAVYLIKKAIEATDSLDKDDICEWIEDLNNAQVISTGRAGYYPLWDGATLRVRKASGLTHPALNSSQLAQIYAAGWYLPEGTGYNYTMPAFTTHDLIYGPRTNASDPNTGWLTGLALQWLKPGASWVQAGVWPKAGYDQPIGPLSLKPQTTFVQTIVGLNWSNEMEYPGIQAMVIPDAYKTVWASWSY